MDPCLIQHSVFSIQQFPKTLTLPSPGVPGEGKKGGATRRKTHGSFTSN